ncbi:hypothetical protein U0070_017451, partial [Myodes glareolus]
MKTHSHLTPAGLLGWGTAFVITQSHHPVQQERQEQAAGLVVIPKPGQFSRWDCSVAAALLLPGSPGHVWTEGVTDDNGAMSCAGTTCRRQAAAA